MRMTIRVALTAILGAVLLLGLAAEPAIAAPIAAHVVVHTAVAAPVTTAPPGPAININQGQQAADAAVAQRKLIMGGVCVVLLVIVYFGRRAKGKHILRVKNLQNAKT